MSFILGDALSMGSIFAAVIYVCIILGQHMQVMHTVGKLKLLDDFSEGDS